jgi:5-methylcytosine-specific restriction protein B
MKKKSERPKEDIKNYVLIIDEINRANISKVFGELITLLEKDKRLGEENELRVLLPNGEKDFCLPPNLYLLGTMNTTDKSIALIDIALRRRFQFVGMYPDYEKLEYEEEIELLKQVNTNIYNKKKSPDFLIGHSYFMNELPTVDIVRSNIIPLLMEYFSGKIDVVESIFEDTNLKVKFNSFSFTWEVEEI